MSIPYYLRSKDTKLPEGHDDTLDAPEPPTDAEKRTAEPFDWAAFDKSKGPEGTPDALLGPPPVDPGLRTVPAFVWPRGLPGALPNRSVRESPELVGALDPDIELWPQVKVNIWPFAGHPTEGIWPIGWFGLDNAGQAWVCVVAGEPGTWAEVGFTSAGVASFDTRTGAVVFELADAETIFTAAGQLLAGTGSGTGDLLAKGTAGQVLTVGGADPSGLEWTTITTDTGWITMTPLENGWTDAGGWARYRRLNGVVYVEVSADGGSAEELFLLPAGFRPGESLQVVTGSSSSGNLALFTINSSGAVSGSLPAGGSVANLSAAVVSYPADA
jgi:hypothetical protein